MAMFNSPQNIKSADFKKRLRGYDPQEVDAALGIMRSRISQLEQEIEDKPEIVITETRHAHRRQADDMAPRTWFEEQWGGSEEGHLDDAFDEFFIGADVVRSPWKNSRRRDA